jgi:excisionase family DNA binding protein
MKTHLHVPQPDNPLLEGLKQLVREAVREELQQRISSDNPKPQKLLMTAAEASEMLSVPKSWLEARAREGKIASIKAGHYRLFSIEDLKQFISSAKSAGEE